jgi:hypothetical protein
MQKQNFNYFVQLLLKFKCQFQVWILQIICHETKDYKPWEFIKAWGASKLQNFIKTVGEVYESNESEK